MNEPIITKHRLPWINRLTGSFSGSLLTVVVASWWMGNAIGFIECLAIGSTWILVPASVAGSVIPTKNSIASFLGGSIASITGIYLLLALVVSRI